MKSFTQKAIYTALAGTSLMLAASAGAVSINQDGMGEALVYPYYTVRNNNVTLFSVVNTTTVSKAVKVRIMEGKNTAEVLDFNLFMSPKDVWTGAIIATVDGAAILSADNSCTNPKVGTTPVPFRNLAYVTDNAALRTLDRTREGYIEVIQMADIQPSSDTDDDVKHDSKGIPTCKLVNNSSVIAQTDDYRVPTGGLFGNGTIAGSSMSTGYNATAIEGTGYTGGVTVSGSVLPNLGSGTNTTAVVVDAPAPGTTRITAARFLSSRAIDAVSATMMHSSLLGEYAFDGVANTDWVITMPTKRRYVNGVTTAIAPFQRVWNGTASNGTGTACVDITIDSYDREEGTGRVDDDFSPTGEAGVPVLCYESTVVSFGKAAGAGAGSKVLGSTNVAFFDAFQTAGKAGGWGELIFGNVSSGYNPELGALASSQTTLVTPTGIGAPVTAAVTFVGLPAIGFSIVAAKFPAASDNFNSSYSLNARRTIK